MSYLEMLFGINWLKRKEKIDQRIEAIEFFLKTEKNVEDAFVMRQILKRGARLSKECEARHQTPKPQWHNIAFEQEYTEFLRLARFWEKT